MNYFIKVYSDLPTHPKVYAIAHQLGIDRLEVVGKLVDFWLAYALHAPSEGDLWGVETAYLDERFGLEFIDALVAIGWVVWHDNGISLPGIREHVLVMDAAKKARSEKARAAAAARWSKQHVGDSTTPKRDKMMPEHMPEQCPSNAQASAEHMLHDAKKKIKNKNSIGDGGPEPSSTQNKRTPSDLKRTMESIEEEFGRELTFRTYERMKEWCTRKGETPSLRRLVTWLRAEVKEQERFAAAAPAAPPPNPLTPAGKLSKDCL